MNDCLIYLYHKVLPYFEKYAKESDSIPLIVGGDMNSPSHLDWSEKTKNIHNGLVVPWYSTKVFEDLGFTDSFREKNPNPIKYPGITWDHKERDDSHRIDYIFYKVLRLMRVPICALFLLTALCNLDLRWFASQWQRWS